MPGRDANFPQHARRIRRTLGGRGPELLHWPWLLIDSPACGQLLTQALCCPGRRCGSWQRRCLAPWTPASTS